MSATQKVGCLLRSLVKANPCKSQGNATFLQKRFLSAHERINGRVQIGVLGAPVQSGQRNHGVHLGPKAIRDAGLVDHLVHHVGMDIKDYGDVDVDFSPNSADFHVTGKSPVRNVKSTGFATKQIADKVEEILQSSDVCVTLGGDHSTAIGTISGHARVRSNLSVLWVDAHPDLNSPDTSPSGNLHGMPLHFLMHDLQNLRLLIPEFHWCKPCVMSPNIGFIAIRDIDPGEIAIMKRYNIPHCSIREIDRNGIAHCMEKILDMINPSGNRPIHLSYDIDALDPSIASATGTPVMGGLTYREAMYIGEEVARTGCLGAMDLVEVNPELGHYRDAKGTAEVAVDVITHALGLSMRDTDYRRFPHD